MLRHRLDKSHFRTVSLWLLWLSVLAPFWCQAHSDEAKDQHTYSLGVLPYLVPRYMAETYGPAVASISEETGLHVHLRTTSSFPKFLANLRSQQYDFVVVQPFDVIEAVDKLNYRPLARISIQLESILVVPENSPLHTLNDLKGKIIAMAPKPAATSRMGRVMLKQAGIDLDEDVNIKYFNSHDSCLQELLNNHADGCVTGPPPLKLFMERTGVSMRVMATTPTIPHIALLVHSRVNTADAEQVLKVMTSWGETEKGRKILAKMAFPGWRTAKIEDYDDVRRVLAADKNLQPNKGNHQVYQQEEGLIFGAFPYFPPKRLARQLSPLPQTFSRALNTAVHLRTTSSYTGFKEHLEDGMYDIALVQPFDYDRAVKSGYLPLAQLNGRIAATFYVVVNSPLQDLNELQGKIIAMPPVDTAVSRLGLQYLKQHGLKPGQDVQIEYRRSHDSCIDHILSKQADVCVTTRQVVQMMPEEMKEVRVLSESKSIPSILLMAHNRLSETQRKALQDDILSWGGTVSGQEMLRTMNYDPFVPFVATDYQSMLH